MFVGREKELQDLQRIFNSNRFECVVVYGRRRVGKTTLISKACEGYRTIFHLATKTTEKKTLSDVSVSACEGLGEGDGLEFGNLDVFLGYIANKAAADTLVFVIDEFPLLVQSIADSMGSLQRFIDLKFSHTKLKLVLCGSSVSFMEHQVLGEKSPLYGRRTAQIKLKPFELMETKQLYGGTELDTVSVQLITGGVPLYVSYFSSEESIEATVNRVCFNSNGLLYNEPMNILNMEVNEPQAFFSILEFLAHGVNKQFELADKSGMSAPHISYYLSTLRDIGIIDKKVPFGETNRKKTLWYIADELFLFYFAHVYPYRALIERGVNEGVLARFKHNFTTYAGRPFEALCMNHLLAKSSLPITKIGTWWGSDPRSKSEEEIDVVARTIDGDMIFGECKYTSAPMGSDVYDDLVRISMNVHSEGNRYYWFFSKAGFTTGMLSRAVQNPMVHLVSVCSSDEEGVTSLFGK